MCGIFGIVNVSPKPIEGLSGFVSDALIAGAVRGADSCGIALLDSAADVMMHKDVLSSTSFLTSRATKALLDNVDHAYMVIGHNRAATVGEVTVDAAHPFRLTSDAGISIVGVHNGTLTGYKLKDDGAEYISDSEWMFSKLLAAAAYEDGDRIEAVADILGGLAGSYSVMFFFDDDPTRMYMSSNGRRPLYGVMSSNNKYCLFASEPGMLHWLAERNKLDITGTILSAQQDQLYVFNLEEEAVKYSKHSVEWQRMFQDTTPSTTELSPYTGCMADLNKLATKYAVEVAPSVSTLPALVDTVAEQDDDMAAAIAAIRGMNVEFFISEADSNTRTLFGTFWQSSEQSVNIPDTIWRLVCEGKMVIYCGRDEARFSELVRNQDTIWKGEVVSVANITVTCAKTNRPIKQRHAVIKLSSVAEYSSIEGAAA